MNLRDQLAGDTGDPVLSEALKHFKASVDAWSEAAYSRPRMIERTLGHSWRLAAGWALGCVLAAGSLAGGVFEHQHRQELAKIASMKAAQKAAHERLLAAQAAAAAQEALEDKTSNERSNAATSKTNADENLLATVDSDVSQEVPVAMEPLAQLMDVNGSQ
jgi:ribosomal protein S25